MATVKAIMDFMEKTAPLRLTSKDDNAGLLVGSCEDKADKVMLCLDITVDVINEAAEKHADVIISHHPIIFKPSLSSISVQHPAGLALKKGIACLCYHTSLDIADGGITDMMYSLLKEPLGLGEKLGFLEQVCEDKGFGLICNMNEPVEPKKAAHMIKETFGCSVLRYHDGGKPLKKIAFCSGGGDWLSPVATRLGADAYLCGDIRHHHFIAAQNEGYSIFDAGHYHTEVIFIPCLKKRLEEAFPALEIFTAQSCSDPAGYIF
ncbi:MAG: Nif3-like dinuclear metal center hexameric protein [Oscillospiraceae bacterium]|nr:Nif3-like dinuclear metal center hexameric protein [Oscillospiraceae bacterium]